MLKAPPAARRLGRATRPLGGGAARLAVKALLVTKKPFRSRRPEEARRAALTGWRGGTSPVGRLVVARRSEGRPPPGGERSSGGACVSSSKGRS